MLNRLHCWLCRHISLDIVMLSSIKKDDEIARLRAALTDISIMPVSKTNPTATLWEIRRKVKEALDGGVR